MSSCAVVYASARHVVGRVPRPFGRSLVCLVHGTVAAMRHSALAMRAVQLQLSAVVYTRGQRRSLGLRPCRGGRARPSLPIRVSSWSAPAAASGSGWHQAGMWPAARSPTSPSACLWRLARAAAAAAWSWSRWPTAASVALAGASGGRSPDSCGASGCWRSPRGRRSGRDRRGACDTAIW